MTEKWVQVVDKPGAQKRLYVFPYAGGNSAAFIPWSRGLGPDIELAVIHLPGRGLRMAEPSQSSLRDIAMSIAGTIAQDNAANFAFFGHSMGAVLMLEVARIATLMQLRRPQLMIASGCRWPGQLEPEGVHELPDDALIERLRDMCGTPDEVLDNREMMEIALPALRSDFAMLDTYRYRPGIAINTPLHVFAGQDDAIVKAEHLDGWLTETEQPGAVHWFEDAHFFIHSQQEKVLDKVRSLYT